METPSCCWWSCLPQLITRLETIAELAVGMRETLRRLSEEWRGQVPHLDGNAGARAETIADADVH